MWWPLRNVERAKRACAKESQPYATFLIWWTFLYCSRLFCSLWSADRSGLNRLAFGLGGFWQRLFAGCVRDRAFCHLPFSCFNASRASICYVDSLALSPWPKVSSRVYLTNRQTVVWNEYNLSPKCLHVLFLLLGRLVTVLEASFENGLDIVLFQKIVVLDYAQKAYTLRQKLKDVSVIAAVRNHPSEAFL